MAATRYPYQVTVPLGYRDQRDFGRPEVGRVRPGNFGSAAGIVDIGSAYASLADKTDYDSVIQNQLVNNSNDMVYKIGVEGGLIRDKLITDAQIASAKYAYDTGIDAISTGRDTANRASTLSTIGEVAKIALPFVIKGLSDEKLKNTIQDLENATAKLRELHPVTFKYNKETGYDPERTHHGFIAQQYKEVLPDATYEENGILSIDIMDVIGILVKGFQEMDTRIARLEATRSLAGVK